jgi:hypothetical protein
MLLLAILVWGLLAIIVGIEANARGRSAIGWSTLAFLISPFVAGGILLLPTWRTSVDDQSLEQNIQVAQLALPGWGSVEFWMKDCG